MIPDPEGAIQAAAAVGLQARRTDTEIRIEKGATVTRRDRVTHLFPVEASPEQVKRIFEAGGKDAILSTAGGAVIITITPDRVQAVLEAAKPR